MPIPLIPLVAGAVIGGLATYLYRDEKIQADVKRTAGDVADKVKGASRTVSGKVTEGYEDLRDKIKSKTSAKQTQSRKKATKKTASAKKKVARKKVAKKKATSTAKGTVKKEVSEN
jgi:adenylate kinase